MKLDTNLAWQGAQAAIKGNKEVLIALAGAFFFLPTLAFALLYPQPAAPSGMTAQQTAAVVEAFYRESFPFMLPIILIQVIGSMAILKLFTDRTRPTVGGALGAGVVDTVIFLAAMLLFSVVGGLALGLVIGLVALSGVAALATLVTAIGFAAMLYCGFRLILIMPVIAIEGLHNPLLALRRSWDLTRGNVGRIFVFLFLLMVVYMVASVLATAIGGLGFALVLGVKGGQIAIAILTAVVGAIATLYVIAVLAMIHRQLAGESPAALGTTFD